MPWQHVSVRQRPASAASWLNPAWLPELYLIVAGLLLTSFCLLVPPFFGADEGAHAERAIQLAHGEWVPARPSPGMRIAELADRAASSETFPTTRAMFPDEFAYGGLMDTEFLHISMRMTVLQREFLYKHHDFLHRPDGRLPEATVSPLRSSLWSRQQVYANFKNTAVYPPAFYVLSAAAWGIGQSHDFSIMHTLLLARALNSLAALLLGWLALRSAGPERPLLFAFLVLPALMAIEASCSQDALLLPSAALCVSLVSRAVRSGRQFRSWELLAVTAILAASIVARPVYLPMVALLFLPLLQGNVRSLRRWVAPTVCLLAIGMALLGWRHVTRVGGLNKSYLADPAQQMHFILTHPLHASFIIIGRTVTNLPGLLSRGVPAIEMQGLPAVLLLNVLPLIAFFGILLFGAKVPLRLRCWMLLLASVAVSVLGTSLIEYLIWNAPGAGTLDGVQARYYLPLVPALFFFTAARWNAGRPATQWVRDRLLPCAVVVYLAFIACQPWVLAHRYSGLPVLQALRYSVQ